MNNLWILVKVLFGEIDQLNNIVEIGFVWQASFQRPDLLSRLLELCLLQYELSFDKAQLLIYLQDRLLFFSSCWVAVAWVGDAGKKKFCWVTTPPTSPKKGWWQHKLRKKLTMTCKLAGKAAMDDDGMKAQALTSCEQTAEISVKTMFMQFYFMSMPCLLPSKQYNVSLSSPPHQYHHHHSFKVTMWACEGGIGIQLTWGIMLYNCMVQMQRERERYIPLVVDEIKRRHDARWTITRCPWVMVHVVV